jgi:hypothetical protein
MSSGQKSLISYFKRNENVEESDNNSTKKSKIKDNINNIQALSNVLVTEEV